MYRVFGDEKNFGGKFFRNFKKFRTADFYRRDPPRLKLVLNDAVFNLESNTFSPLLFFPLLSIFFKIFRKKFFPPKFVLTLFSGFLGSIKPSVVKRERIIKKKNKFVVRKN